MHTQPNNIDKQKKIEMRLLLKSSKSFLYVNLRKLREIFPTPKSWGGGGVYDLFSYKLSYNKKKYFHF